ncbi:MAG: DUF6168 family protein [Salinimicrobium sediminis]|nr:DUF6168 family protein [Salinimicrobium sediminis]
MFNDLLKFSFYLFLTAGASYALHYTALYFLELDAPLELVNFAYKFNIGISFLFTSTTILLSEKLKDQLGFIFLITGAVKIGIFIFLIKSSGFSTDKSVFLHFFVPYLVCVMVEIIYIIKILNRTNFSNDR